MLSQAGVYWNSVADHWTASRPQKLWRAHSDAVNTDLLNRWLGRRHFERVLKTDLFDETCGPGLYPLLQRRGRLVYGIDLSTSASRAAARQFPRLRGTAADVRRLPFADGAFDLIVSNSTLDHFEAREEIFTGIAELARVLKSGGELILTLDNATNPAIALRNALPCGFLKAIRLTPYYVGATCGATALSGMIARAGLREMETAAVMHCPRVLGVAAASLLERCNSSRWQSRYLSLLMKFESLARWPTRYLSGYFVAIKAVKP